MSTTTTLSAKGQLIIPKAIRDRHGWTAGLTLEVIEQGESVLLRPVRALSRTSVDDLLGCLPYEGPPKTLAEMEGGSAKKARKRR